MSIFSSITNYLGSSKSHYANAANNLEKASTSATEVCSQIGSTVIALPSTVYDTAKATAAGFIGYEYAAGKIISTNAAIQTANYFTCHNELGFAVKATQTAAYALVKYPMGCMTALVATSILAANSDKIIPVIKGVANLTWETAKTAFYLTSAAAETVAANTLFAVESVDSMLTDISDFVEKLDLNVMGLSFEDDMVACF